MVACDVQRFANSARDLIVEHKSQRRHTLLSLTTTPWRAALAFSEDVEDVRLPVEWLKQCCIVDTPGTNAIVARHEQLTQRIVPRADIVIFVTSADRPFSESERAFLQTIKQYHKKVVIVVNKVRFAARLIRKRPAPNLTAFRFVVEQCDIVRTEPEVTAVLDFVRTHGRALLGHAPKVFGVSAQLALDAKLAAGDASPTLGAGAAQWERSRFAHLEAHMRELLSAEERVARKLLTPLGVGEQVTSDALARLAQRKQVLHGDLATLSLIESNMQAFADDMERDLKHERAQIAKTVEEMVARADSWFSANISILNAHMLLTDAGKFEATFRDEVLGSTSERIDEIVTDMSTLVERRARAQSRAVLEASGHCGVRVISESSESSRHTHIPSSHILSCARTRRASCTPRRTHAARTRSSWGGDLASTRRASLEHCTMVILR
jgi:hypothetical protein